MSLKKAAAIPAAPSRQVTGSVTVTIDFPSSLASDEDVQPQQPKFPFLVFDKQFRMENVEFDNALFFLNMGAMLRENGQSYPKRSKLQPKRHLQTQAPRNHSTRWRHPTPSEQSQENLSSFWILPVFLKDLF